MIDISSIAAVASSLKTAGDITKTAIGLRDAQALQAKIIELNHVIIAAQSSAISAHLAQTSLVERIRELETKLAQLEGWEVEKKRYALKDYGGDTFAYELKSDAAEGEPSDRICAACYQQGNKSILQFKDKTYARQDAYECPACKTVFALGHRNEPPRPTVRRSSDWAV